MQKLAAILFAASFASFADVADAADRSPIDAHLIVDLGAFFLSTDTHVRVDGETTTARGTEINFDRTFGLRDGDRFRLDGLWRISGRHSLRALYFRNKRSSTRTLDRDVQFGDTLYPVSASVEAHSDLTVAQLSYDYAFYRSKKSEVAIGFGVHYMDISFRLIGRGGTLTSEQSASTKAPLPVIGLHWLWGVSPSFYVTAQAQYFYVDFDDYRGRLLDSKVSAVWQFTDHFGLGVGYNDFRVHVSIDKRPKFEGELSWNYSGALAFATFMF